MLAIPASKISEFFQDCFRNLHVFISVYHNSATSHKLGWGNKSFLRWLLLIGFGCPNPLEILVNILCINSIWSWCFEKNITLTYSNVYAQCKHSDSTLDFAISWTAEKQTPVNPPNLMSYCLLKGFIIWCRLKYRIYILESLFPSQKLKDVYSASGHWKKLNAIKSSRVVFLLLFLLLILYLKQRL